MTLQCPNCDTIDVELVDSNGAKYPQTRVEWFDCHQCGNTFKIVLTA